MILWGEEFNETHSTVMESVETRDTYSALLRKKFPARIASVIDAPSLKLRGMSNMGDFEIDVAYKKMNKPPETINNQPWYPYEYIELENITVIRKP